MHRKFFNLALIISLAIGTVFAQQMATRQDVPSVERLRAHINYLASDKLEGRRTGSEGANLAAEYIAREFSRYGLQRSIGWDTSGMSILEADSPNRYLQKFPYVAGVELGNGNTLRLTPQNPNSPTGRRTISEPMDFRVGEDWMPLGFSSNAHVELAPAAFVHYGITATDLNYDDYKERSVKGDIVVALQGTPDGDNPHGQFARYEDVRWKAIAARNAGAKALLVISREVNFKDERLARLRYDNSAGDAGLPVAVISRQAARNILLAGGEQVDLANIEKFLIETVARKVEFGPPGQGNKSPGVTLHNRPVLSLQTSIARREVEAANVVGIVNGFDPVLKNETIVIGAHYDHLGRGGEGSLVPREGDIHHGADDNASGTAGLLELARIFASSGSPRPRRTIVFIAFSGEEEGLLGSSYYVNHPLKPLENTVAMINMDMIGRMKNNKLIVGGVGTADGWRKVIDSSAKFWGIGVTPTPDSYGGVLPGTLTANPSRSGTATTSNVGTTAALDSIRSLDLTLSEDGYGPSDHSSFYAKKVPVLFLWTGTHEDYHKPSDTADKINYEDESHILSFVARIIQSIDANSARPAYTVAKSESQGRTMGFRVYLGTIPNYSDSGDGLLLDGVRDDSPAAKAGIKAGDRIVRLAGREVHNVYDYTYALGEMKAGQEYEVELLRGTERMKLTITPAARK
ncbi:MAG: M20/M25/M40 family metallo-hydrolase [Blastocatellia bacterium]|nr:M20/M25/M40 family metallo-hydrolase [Blastocatellia bacterium]